MTKRPPIPKRLEKSLYQEANSRCFVCGSDEIATLEIHHIVPFEEIGAHHVSDMIVLCRNCHAKAHSGEISRDKLYQAKRSAKTPPLDRPNQVVPSSGTVIGHGAIVAGGSITAGGDIRVTVLRQTHRSRASIIPGTVATDRFKIGYLKYLATRHQDFKEYEVGKDQTRYPVIYKSYQREIRFSIEQTPLERFEVAIEYLQQRINNTKLGRIRRGQGQKLYSTFNEFAEES